MAALKGLYLYKDRPSPALSIEEVVAGLESLGLHTEYRGDFLRFLGLGEDELHSLAARIAAIRVGDIESLLDRPTEPEKVDVEREAAGMSGDEPHTDAFYDGNWLQRIYFATLSPRAASEPLCETAHLVFTGRLIGTFETRRYHARVIIGGMPALLSTSGVVEAPARPREYYFMKAKFAQSGRDTAELERAFEGRFLTYDDPKITSAMKSYALQAVFFQAAGREFCPEPGCCLFNSHWQEEVLRKQVDGVLCAQCRKVLEEFT